MALIWVMFLLLAFILLGIPASFSLGFISVIHLAVERGIKEIPYWLLAQRTLYGIDSFPLLAIPLFVLMGRVMNESGTTKLYNFANMLVGHFKAGLAHVSVVGGMLFAGMSGTATADAAALGSVGIKAMADAGYDPDFAAGVTSGAATIGPIIPPSMPAVFYAMLANVSVGAVLIAGFVPGVMMGLAMMVQIAIIARKRNFPVQPRATFRQIWTAFREAFLTLLTPAILIVGILVGVFTATEAAAVAAAYAVFLSCFVYRTTSLRRLWEILRQSALDSSVLMFILATSSIYGWLMTKAQIPAMVAQAMLSVSSNLYVIYLLIIVLLLILGCFISAVVSINILTPILVPVIVSLGGNPIHFGVIMILTLMIGELTPPFGMVLYTTMKVWPISFDRLVKNALPFAISIMVVTLLVLFVPKIAMFLPSLFLK